MSSNIETLKRTAQELRRTVINMIHCAGSGHSGGSLSCAEILTVLYDEMMNMRADQPDWPGRDRFVLSKGHAAPALYATLVRKGFLDEACLGTLRRFGSCLEGHPCMFKQPGVEMSTGSLGMGISVGVGMALAAKQNRASYHTYVLCGDGELQEGQNWEAMASASKWNLDNLTVIVDHNRVQLDGTVDEVMPVGSLADKMKAFGMQTIECDGHDAEALLQALKQAVGDGRPTAVIAHTVKGKGVSFMEGQSAWHGKPISDEDYTAAIKEIEEGLA